MMNMTNTNTMTNTNITRNEAIAAYNRIRTRCDLVMLAKTKNSRVTYAAGNSGSGSSRRVHRCNICNEVVASDSNRYGMTKASAVAVVEHLKAHTRPLTLVVADQHDGTGYRASIADAETDEIVVELDIDGDQPSDLVCDAAEAAAHDLGLELTAEVV